MFGKLNLGDGILNNCWIFSMHFLKCIRIQTIKANISIGLANNYIMFFMFIGK